MQKAVLAFMLFGAIVSALDQHLAVTLTHIDVQDRVMINMQITNVGKSPVQLLFWNTPFDGGVKNDIFSVIDQSGQRATYLGIMAKRGPPALSSFRPLMVNQNISIGFDLSESYQLKTGSDSNYSIRFDSMVHYLPGLSLNIVHPSSSDSSNTVSYSHVLLDTLTMTPLSSDSINIVLKDGYQLHPPPRPHTNNGVGFSFISCTTDRQSQINTAVTTAKSMASSSLSYLTSSSCDSAFVTWFGRYTGSSRWSMIQQNFNRISAKLNSGVFNVNCAGPSCSSDTFAYVYPTDSSFTVYVCGAFWSAPNYVAYDSKPGTLIHEMSHFSVIGGTQDHTYGTSSAKDLASRQPDKAVNNADNHEYFAESSPRC